MATVLVVDDEPLTCKMLQASFNRAGHHVVIATSGLEALDQFRRQVPDVTVLDLIMPGMDGFDVLKEIRALFPQAPVVILTAWGSPQAERKARSLGATGFVRKDEAINSLPAVAGRILGASQPGPPEVQSSPLHRRRHPRINLTGSEATIVVSFNSSSAVGRILDVSATGVSFQLDKPLSIPESLNARLKLPLHPALPSLPSNPVPIRRIYTLPLPHGGLRVGGRFER